MSFAKLRSLYDSLTQIRKTRIAFQLRLDAIRRGKDAADPVQIAICERYYQTFTKMERALKSELEETAMDFPFYFSLLSVRGIGPSLAYSFLSSLPSDRCTFDTVSRLWRYCGYAVVDGRAERRQRGKKNHFNSRLRSICYTIGTMLIKKDSPYRAVYDDARRVYDERGFKPRHAHMAALRKVIKLWLAHAWEVWRRIDGLPVQPAYIFSQESGHTYLAPEDFGWEVK